MKAETIQWLDLAEGDYDSGVHLYERGRYPQSIYLLCQAIEKVLKASLIEFADKPPPYSHRLEIIAKDTTIAFTQEQYEQLLTLSKHYSKVRYPDFAQTQYNTKLKSTPIVRIAQSLYVWIFKQFKSH